MDFSNENKFVQIARVEKDKLNQPKMLWCVKTVKS
jgi:hypothetical protein